ncbi:MAG: glycolate oxidase subunit GlcE [Burkholderiales bacterium]|nr:glycolate oxidase subunit GlcE [Burkholderiales bacterium]
MTWAGLVDAVKSAGAHGRALRVRGGGSKDFYGQALEGDVLDTRAVRGIVAHEPTELVLTARGGTPLAEVEDVLARAGQMLPFEPPHFGPGATIGGAVAAGLAGPRRAATNGYTGAIRDFVLGVTLLDGRGEVLRFGGRVMKNVAGYDVSRLIAGSMGTLGVILEVSLKVLPRPPAACTLRLALPDPARAIEQLNAWGGMPLPLTASAYRDGDLALRLEGAESAVKAACRRIGGERVDDAAAAAFWTGMREQTDPFFSLPGALWRVAVPSTAVPLGLPGAQLVEWGGALRWLKGDADAALVRREALRAGGHATLFRGGDKAVGVFTALDPVKARIHARLKAAFDPARVFNRGRMYAEL